MKHKQKPESLDTLHTHTHTHTHTGLSKEKIITIFMILFTIIVILFVGGKYVYAKYIVSKKISIPISTAPAPTTVEITVAKNTDGTATITANAKDNGSGVKEYKFYINNQLESTVDATSLLSPLKSTYKFTYISNFNNSFDCKVVIADKYNTINTSNTVTIVDYNIRTANDLKEFSTQTNNGNTYKGVTIEQAADIDLKGSASNPWTMVGKFEGTYDGQGHTIKGLYVNESTSGNAFMKTNLGIIKNLGIDGSASGGGLVLNNSGTISGCYSSVTVNYNGGQVGGICSFNVGTITNCYNKGNITEQTGNTGVGGITGRNFGTITNCYNYGSVKIVGYNNKGAGIAGWNDKEISNCYWLNTSATDGVMSIQSTATNTGVTSKTSAQLKALASTLGSAFKADTNNINGGYPILTWQ